MRHSKWIFALLLGCQQVGPDDGSQTSDPLFGSTDSPTHVDDSNDTSSESDPTGSESTTGESTTVTDTGGSDPTDTTETSPEVECGGLESDGSWPAAWLECEQDSDCSETSLNCCPCEQGGEYVPIRAGYEHCPLECQPGEVMCAQVIVCDDLLPMCVAGVCARG